MTSAPSAPGPQRGFYDWVVGFVLAAAAAGLALAVGVLGLVPALALMAWAVLRRPSLPALSGITLGAGLSIAGLLLRAQAACSNPPPGQSCEGPDLTGFFAVAIVLVGIGVATGVIAFQRSRPEAPGAGSDTEDA